MIRTHDLKTEALSIDSWIAIGQIDLDTLRIDR